MVIIDDSIRIRLNTIMNAKLHAMHVFCQRERDKGSCQCAHTLKCCEHNPSRQTCLLPECEKILSNILLCDIGDIINFPDTPRSSVPEDILKEAMKHRENVAPDKECKHLQTETKSDQGMAEYSL